MKKIIIILSFFILQTNFSQDLKQIPFNKKQYKLLNTYTIKVADSSSLHFIVAKNLTTKRIDFLPYYATNLVKKLATFSFDKQPILLSTHIYKNKLVLIYKKAIKSKEIFSKAFDFIADKISTPKLIFDIDNTYDILITLESRTIFISFSKFRLKVTTVYDSDKIAVNSFSTKTKKDQEMLKGLKSKNIFLEPASYKFDYVATNKYVEIGSIKTGHFFLDSNILILTRDVKKKANTSFLKLDLNKTQKQYLNFREFKNKLKKVKQIRSFYFEDKLFQFAISSQDASLQIFDVSTGLILKTFDYTKSNFGPYNKYFFKSKEIEPNPSRFFNSFKKFRPYSMYFPSIFIVANKSTDNGFVVEMGHINGAVYNYNSFNMMWQMQQMQWQMQNNIMNFHPPSFRGPDGIFDYEYVKTTDNGIRKTSFILSLDKNLNKTEKVATTIFKKDTLRKKIDDLRSSDYIKMLSYEVSGDVLRYTYYYQPQRKVIIKEYRSHD